MRVVFRYLLAASMVFAGLSHLFWARRAFQAQVPDWSTKVLHLDKDAVVVASGAAEVAIGVSLAAFPRERRRIGGLLAVFFAAVFPGNVEQFVRRRAGFGLNTDGKRFVRLLFQPVLVIWAIWSTRS